jgi:hypothetical protein
MDLQEILTFANCPEHPFFQTPYFQRYFNTKDCQSYTGKYEIVNYIKSITTVSVIWPNINIDYFQNHLSTLEFMVAKNLQLEVPEVQEWLKKNITHTSFFNMLSRAYAGSELVKNDGLLKDTFNQLSTMLKEKCEIERPKRWRLGDFHDHISFLYLKREIVNVEHETTFIPVPLEKDRGKVYQPKDTLELALWGKKVGNCVLSYEDRIKGEESVIVLIEEESEPMFTIELGVDKKNIHIKQATMRPGNKSLTSEQTQLCTDLIKAAIGQ